MKLFLGERAGQVFGPLDENPGHAFPASQGVFGFKPVEHRFYLNERQAGDSSCLPKMNEMGYDGSGVAANSAIAKNAWRLFPGMTGAVAAVVVAAISSVLARDPASGVTIVGSVQSAGGDDVTVVETDHFNGSLDVGHWMNPPFNQRNIQQMESSGMCL